MRAITGQDSHIRHDEYHERDDQHFVPRARLQFFWSHGSKDRVSDVIQVQPYIKEDQKNQSPERMKTFAENKEYREEKKDDIPNQSFSFLPVINLPGSGQYQRQATGKEWISSRQFSYSYS